MALTERPYLAHEYDYLAKVAADLLTEREDRYPDLIAEAKLTPERAADGIRVMKAIGADYTRMAALTSTPPAHADPRDTTASTAEKSEALEHCLRRAETRFANACTLFRAACPDLAKQVDGGWLLRADLVELHRSGAPRQVEISALIHAERRLHACQALVHNAALGSVLMLCAEATAEWRAGPDHRAAA